VIGPELLFTLIALTWLTTSGVNIRVHPAAILRGSSVWLTCRVTPNAQNRMLVYGIVNSEQENTQRQLDGYDARITWGPVEIKHLGCDAGPAYCVVFRADGTSARQTAPIAVAGCEP